MNPFLMMNSPFNMMNQGQSTLMNQGQVMPSVAQIPGMMGFQDNSDNVKSNIYHHLKEDIITLEFL